MRRVTVYVPRLLPLSQTFVADQTRALRRWEPTMIGRQRVPHGLDVGDLTGPRRPDEPRAAWHHPLTRRVHGLGAAVHRSQPDLVHAHFLTGALDIISSVPLTTPMVTTVHGFDATWFGSLRETRRPSQLLYGLQRRHLLKRRLKLLAVSECIRSRLFELGADPCDVHVHHIGVDTSYFQPTGEPPPSGRILFVGRLVAKKGAADLLRAVSHMSRLGHAVAVTMVGDGPERSALESIARTERLMVDFVGPQPRAEVRRQMSMATVLCAPSRTDSTGDREGLGMVLAEAQAMGVPVVATRSGGITDVVEDRETGLLVPEGDTAGLSAALHRCLTEPDLRRALGEAGRRRVLARFDLTTQTAALEDLYDQWLEPRRLA